MILSPLDRAVGEGLAPGERPLRRDRGFVCASGRALHRRGRPLQAAGLEGDLIVLGVAGKMGPSLARMAKRASDLAGVPRRILGVARFSSAGVEADLQRHLSNDREKADPTAVEQQPVEPKSEPQSRADEPEKDQKDQKDTKDQKPIELGSPDDFQLKQAINHLKGLPVLARIELDAKADTSPASTQAKAEAPARPVGKAQPKKN